MDFVIVLAKLTPKSGCLDSIVELSQDLIYESQQEEGNIEYELLNSINEENLTFVEKWKSIDDLKKHMASPHFLTFSEESEEFVEKNEIQIIGADELDL